MRAGSSPGDSGLGDSPADGFPVDIRPLGGLDEFAAAVALQEATWGAGFSERVPTSLMKVAQRTGGVASGAFDPGGVLVGFVFGIAGLRDGELVHWSDMLAVDRRHRGRGLGRALKLHQRERVRAIGVSRMYWTADPLEAGNAHLNLNRLGARAIEYRRDFYGDSDSPLHQGLGTDRFVLSWSLEEDPPPAAPEWRPESLPAALEAGGGGGPELPRPGAVTTALDPPFRVALPAEIQEMKRRDPELAREWRRATRAVLEPALQRGCLVDAVAGRAGVAWLRVAPGSRRNATPPPANDDDALSTSESG